MMLVWLLQGPFLFFFFFILSNNNLLDLSFVGQIFLICSYFAHCFFISFLFMPLHESVHQTVFRSILLNQFLSWVTGVLTFRPPYHYKLYHFAHHKHTGDPKKDPELQNSWIDPNLESIGGYVLYLSGFPFWVDRFSTTLRHCIFGRVLPSEFYIYNDQAKRSIIKEAKIFWLIYGSLAALGILFPQMGIWFLLFWIIPSFLGQPCLRFYLLAEHYGCKQGPDMLANTRTTYTFKFYQALSWNMPFHAEHHAFPYVPFHSLPKLAELLQSSREKDSQCKPSGKGYLHVNLGFIQSILSKSKN